MKKKLIGFQEFIKHVNFQTTKYYTGSDGRQKYATWQLSCYQTKRLKKWQRHKKLISKNILYHGDCMSLYVFTIIITMQQKNNTGESISVYDTYSIV